MGGGTSLHPPKSSFLGGQQGCEAVKLHLLYGYEFLGCRKQNGVGALWGCEDPLWQNSSGL